MSDELKSENRNQSLQLNVDVWTNASIISMQDDFPLCESDYLRLKNGKSKGTQAAVALFLSSVGFGIVFLAKCLSSYIDGKPFVYDTWEWVAPAIAGTISLLVYLLYSFMPNDHKKVMKAIEDHFKAAPRTRYVKRCEL